MVKFPLIYRRFQEFVNLSRKLYNIDKEVLCVSATRVYETKGCEQCDYNKKGTNH